jgi:hypothetical protein
VSNNLVAGCVTVAACIAVQCVIVSLMLRALVTLERTRSFRLTIPVATVILTAVMLTLLAGNLLQISMWAGVFLLYGEFHDFATAFYYSTVTFSTLGYGDIVMGKNHRLLGGLEALNGVLMLGLTSSVLFAVFHAMAGYARAEREGRDRESGAAGQVRRGKVR